MGLEIFPFLIFTESLASLLVPNMEIITGLGRSCRKCSQGSEEQAAQSFHSMDWVASDLKDHLV